MTRVLSSPEARAAITKMQSIINGGLMSEINQLNTQGQHLSDPNVWDGRLAQEFRGLWPETKATLDRMQQQLEQLRQKVDRINQDIMAAGGNV